MSFFAVGQWVKRDLAGQAGTSSQEQRWKRGKRGLLRPKRKPGHIDRVAYAFAPQYRQKTPKNNAFFQGWLIEFCPGIPGA
ncbi:hypothetical protein ACFQZO_34075 [Bradyrhizobium sp. GCM10027634]|uniref:hypothetical protein n=1 Tax=unclassified Bradyrhizobium TaxID=2631580 RepID=UPI00188D70A4|nr:MULTISPECIES: hypothetical protein [unclassified Bradyrhizobium]MDN5005883.1 hypothetical protein [Bradyrhizobium sp. WYCCWR 12677]